MQRAAQNVEPALQKFYSSLSDEQERTLRPVVAAPSVIAKVAFQQARELKGRPQGRPFQRMHESGRLAAYLGCGRAHISVDVLLELHEVLLEHALEYFRSQPLWQATLRQLTAFKAMAGRILKRLKTWIDSVVR